MGASEAEYAHLFVTHTHTHTHTHTPTPSGTPVHMEALTLIQPHTLSHTDMCPHTNLFTYAGRHP